MPFPARCRHCASPARDRGDLILDNMREEIVSWDRTGYRFVKRQSALNPNDWVSIQIQGDPKTAVAF